MNLKMFLATSFLAATAIASPVGGSFAADGVLGVGNYIAYAIPLRGGTPTVVIVRGDGDGDIDCALFDENGNVVDSDDDATDTCYLSVTPRWQGNFGLYIQNSGSDATYYTVRAR